MKTTTAWIATGIALLVTGCAASGARDANAPAKPATDRSVEVGPSREWGRAVEDARDACGNVPADEPCLAIRIEDPNGALRAAPAGTAMQPASYPAASSETEAGFVGRPRAYIDGVLAPATFETAIDASPAIAAFPASAGRHEIDVEIPGRRPNEVVRKRIDVTLGSASGTVVRAVVSRGSSGGTISEAAPLGLELVTLDAGRASAQERIDADLSRIDAESRAVEIELAARRSSDDARAIACLDDKLSQMIVVVRAADDRRDGGRRTPTAGDDDVLAAQAEALAVLRRRIDRLASIDCS